MKLFLPLLLSFVLSKSAFCQQTIYVAPAPKSYWERKSEAADRALQHQMMLTKQAEDELAKALNDNKQCGNDVRNYYAGMSDYPTIADGTHEAQIVESNKGYYCLKANVLVKGGKVVSIGKTSIANGEPIKNAKTKVIGTGLRDETVFLEVYFIFEK